MERSLIIAFLCILYIGACNKPEPQKGAIAPANKQNSNVVAQESETLDNGLKDLDRTFEELVASYERPDRSDWQKPLAVLPFLGEQLSDKTVAEIGAGSGYFTFRIVPFAEKVIAIDIDSRMLQFIDSCTLIYLPDSLQKRIDTRKATESDPKLERYEADVIFLANTYTFIQDRISYFKNLKNKMNPGGRLVIVDYKRRRIPVGPSASYKLPLYKVEEELMKAGYTEIYANDQLLPYQYIVVAVPN